MNGQINQLVRSLLKKDSLEQCSLEELEQFASRHPYFGAAQLLLTKKLQEENSIQYNEQLQKTYLFFHNPLWVRQLLDDTGNAAVIPGEKEIVQEESTVIPETEEPGTIAPKQGEEKDPGVFTGSFISPVATTNPAEEAPVEQEQKIEEFKPLIEEKQSESPTINLETEVVQHQVKENLFEMPAFKTEPAAAVKEELLFEPFHTVDYFASQGIKIKDEEKPADKFSQQLRSFTDWLKSMKKLPSTEIAARSESGLEKKVEQLAEHSLEEREVLTEAMALVWVKQGNTLKAIEIYKKLSLLDPSKSTYFAAKIEELRNYIT